MKYTERELREIAQGRRLHQSTQGLLAGTAIVLAFNLIFRWDELFRLGEHLIAPGIFLAAALFSYFHERLNALYMLFNRDTSTARAEHNAI